MLSHSEDLEKAREAVGIYRKRQAEAAVARHPRKHRPATRQIKVEDMVLVYDVPRAINLSRNSKVTYRWNGPYKVSKITDKDTYLLKTPAGAELAGTFASNRIKLYVQSKEGWYEPSDHDRERWTGTGRLGPDEAPIDPTPELITTDEWPEGTELVQEAAGRGGKSQLPIAKEGDATFRPEDIALADPEGDPFENIAVDDSDERPSEDDIEADQPRPRYNTRFKKRKRKRERRRRETRMEIALPSGPPRQDYQHFSE